MVSEGRSAAHGGGRLQPLHPDGRPAGDPETVTDLAAAIPAREAGDHPRWVWPSTAELYPALLRAGIRVQRCHDVELTEALLSGHAGRWGEPRALPAAWARLTVKVVGDRLSQAARSFLRDLGVVVPSMS